MVVPAVATAKPEEALRAASDHLAYRPCHRRDGTAGSPEPIHRCHSLRAVPLSVTTTGRAELPEELAAAGAGTRATRKSLPHAGWSSWRTWAGAIPRQADGTTARPSGSRGQTRQSDALDSELTDLCAVAEARDGYCSADTAETRFASCRACLL